VVRSPFTALVVMVVMLTGCPEFPLSLLEYDVGPDLQASLDGHLPSDRSLPDTPSDMAPPDVARPADKAQADATPPDKMQLDTTQPDMAPSDTLPPDLVSPYYVDEEFTSTMGKVAPKTGSWSLSSGQLQQGDNSYNGYYATADVPVSDYVAETRLTIYNLPADPWTQGAGLGVRVQPGAVGAYPPAMYVCVISPDDNVLGIVKCPGGTSFDCKQPLQKIPVQIQLNVAYRMTMKAQGNTMTCSLPDLGQSATHIDNSYTTGGVALATFQTRTRFDYLKVGPP
jgi:hypothetical protein